MPKIEQAFCESIGGGVLKIFEYMKIDIIQE